MFKSSPHILSTTRSRISLTATYLLELSHIQAFHIGGIGDGIQNWFDRWARIWRSRNTRPLGSFPKCSTMIAVHSGKWRWECSNLLCNRKKECTQDKVVECTRVYHVVWRFLVQPSGRIWQSERNREETKIGMMWVREKGQLWRLRVITVKTFRSNPVVEVRKNAIFNKSDESGAIPVPNRKHKKRSNNEMLMVWLDQQ